MRTPLEAAPRRLEDAPLPGAAVPVGPAEHAAALSRASDPLSLYLHIPTLRGTGPGAGARTGPVVDRYLTALIREMDLVTELAGDNRSVAQVHIGGRAPAFLTERQLEVLWKAVARRFDVRRDAEVSIEVDPRATSAAQLEKLRALGFNAVTLAVRDLDDDEAAVDETRRALEAARGAKFPIIGIDVVYGLPGQTPAGWRSTLAHLAGLRPDRVAARAFGHILAAGSLQKRLHVAGNSGDAKIARYLQAVEALTGAGYRQIGNEQFALPTDTLALEAARGTRLRSIQGLTVRAGQDVIGLGVSAISDVGGQAAQNVRSVVQYEARIIDGQLATDRGLLH